MVPATGGKSEKGVRLFQRPEGQVVGFKNDSKQLTHPDNKLVANEYSGIDGLEYLKLDNSQLATDPFQVLLQNALGLCHTNREALTNLHLEGGSGLTQLLSFKKGDLNLIHSKAWYCEKRGDIKSRKLVLKQLDCLDDSIYNMKIHEANLMLNYRHHPNLVNLLSVWKVEPQNSISYKIIYLLFEHATGGNFQDLIMSQHRSFPRKMAFKYLGDIAKGLNFLHHNDCVHGGIRMKNLLVNRKNDGVLGPNKKCELESMRKTRQLLSQFSMERNIKDYFIYWAPELLVDQGVTKASDIWSFGVVIFIICTGQFPFAVNKRDSIFNTIVSGMIKWELLDNWGPVKTLLQGMLTMDPKKRIDSSKVFDFFQREAAKVISRFIGRSVKKVKLVRELKAVVRIQSFFRMVLVQRRLARIRVDRVNNAATKIQKAYRNFKNSKDYRLKRKRIMFLQAQVLSRQTRRAYLMFKKDVVTAQA